ncbi:MULTISPECIES: Stk1 family PASTA domain-containing Ser/Thr kinase [unclassified Candidatus Paralachnospira]|uniref:Stk1 family PASTA domain-containing Ser/Thr kinase n=1 Tax=unclassified Candidatus Paralachnospira TaxID=3099471 RepID=UPI003F93B413
MVKIGMFLGDRYEILERIGSGGMSDVYRAKDHRLNRDVAVKVLKQEFNADKSFVSKFRTEAHAAACLSHPNIVHVFDVGDSDDLHYIVMELVEGITLKTYIAKKGKLEIRETIGIAMQVAQGIEAAHEQHIVHRDIKPQNIIISRDGKVKVTDFGIAKAATSETITSNTMGSVHYISPEQARGGYCDERSDIYSLGITMYEMLTGRVPFEGDSAVSVALLHIQGEMVPPRKYNPMIPVSLEKIVLKCTQKRPEMRYRSVTELISDLKRALMTPNEDFVRMNTINSNGPTRVMSEDEVNQIRNGAAAGAMAGAGYEEAQAAGGEDGYEDGYRGDYEDGYDGSYDDPDEEERYQLDYDDDEYLPDEDDDEPVNKKSDKVYTIVGIVVAVVIVLLALFVLGKTFGFFDFGSGKKNTESMAESDGTEVAMPSLLGKTVSEAEELLKQYDLELKLSYSESKDYEDGQIMEQEFKEGDMVKRHTVVKVTVSKGTTKTTIPDNLVGMTKEQATKALHEADLNPVFDEIYSDTVDEGKVAKISPSLGSEVEIGSDVKLFISKGPETKTVDVPNLLGKSESAAKQLLASANLSVGSITEDYSDEYDEGEVMSQSPGRGQTVEEKTSVDFVVSKGKKDETVPVPDITGMSEADAIARIQSAGLSYRTDRVYSNSTSAGLVDDVYPAAGTKLTKGSTVEIYISRGPRATEAPTTAPTEAPTEPTAPSSEGGENLPDQPAQ